MFIHSKSVVELGFNLTPVNFSGFSTWYFRINLSFEVKFNELGYTDNIFGPSSFDILAVSSICVSGIENEYKIFISSRFKALVSNLNSPEESALHNKRSDLLSFSSSVFLKKHLTSSFLLGTILK